MRRNEEREAASLSTGRRTPLDVQPPGERIAQAVESLKSMADSVRLSILWALLSGELCVGDIAETIDSPPSTVSRHLANLRAARLVSPRRDANRVFYSISDGHVESLVREVVFHTNHLGESSSTSGDAVETSEKRAVLK